MKHKFILLFILLFGINFISAELYTGFDSEDELTVTITKPVNTNISSYNVSSADFWDSLDTPADINVGDLGDGGDYIPYTGANKNVNIGAYNFVGKAITAITNASDTDGVFIDEGVDYTGSSNNYGLRIDKDIAGADGSFNSYGSFIDLDSSRTIGAGQIQKVYGSNVDVSHTFTPSAVGYDYDNWAGYFKTYGTGFVNFAGGLDVIGVESVVDWNSVADIGSNSPNFYGLKTSVNGNNPTSGTSTGYGVYIASVTGTDVGYGIYDASGKNWSLASDNQVILLGAGKDAGIFYDGSDLKINPKYVGSGELRILGNTNTTGSAYIGSDAATGTLQFVVSGTDVILTASNNDLNLNTANLQSTGTATFNGLNLPSLAFSANSITSIVGAIDFGNDHTKQDDNAKAYFGTGGGPFDYDASIYFSGTNLIIKSEDITAGDNLTFSNFDYYKFDNRIAAGYSAVVNTPLGMPISTIAENPGIGLWDTTATSGWIWVSTADGSMVIVPANATGVIDNTGFRMSKDGKIGFGMTTTPATSRLQVVGNSYFDGDVNITGTLYGGSPVKIGGGLNVTSGLIYGNGSQLTSVKSESINSFSGDIIKFDYVWYNLTADDVTAGFFSIPYTNVSANQVISITGVVLAESEIFGDTVTNLGGTELAFQYNDGAGSSIAVADVNTIQSASAGDIVKILITYI